MTTSGNQPNKRAIIDALVLAFSYSDVREVVGTDALRSVLEVEYRELISGTEFNIQPLWGPFVRTTRVRRQRRNPTCLRFCILGIAPQH